MTAPEKLRHELYTGLSKVLGPELTDNLMGYLPTSPGTEVATRSDISDLRVETRAEFAELRSDMKTLYITLIGGFMAVVAAVIATGIWG